MQRIEYKNLQPGDILLTTTTHWKSGIIRNGTKSDISHAMLYVSSSSVIDSTEKGVQARNLQKLFYDDECAIHALRVNQTLSPTALKAIIEYARLQIGMPYSLPEAVRAFTRPRDEGSARQFCSRLVARAYAAGGVKLVDNPDFCTPEQLKSSPLLEILDSPAVSVNEEEVKAIRSHRDGVAGMEQVTNQFLKMVRYLSPEIGSIQDALQFLVKNQTHDKAIADALLESGYLDFWREELEAYPWRYDIHMMLKVERQYGIAAELFDYCQQTLKDDDNGAFKHWFDVLSTAQTNYKNFGLATFRAQASLYENLTAGHKQRVATARAWLAWRRDSGIVPHDKTE